MVIFTESHIVHCHKFSWRPFVRGQQHTFAIFRNLMTTLFFRFICLVISGQSAITSYFTCFLRCPGVNTISQSVIFLPTNSIAQITRLLKVQNIKTCKILTLQNILSEKMLLWSKLSLSKLPNLDGQIRWWSSFIFPEHNMFSCHRFEM